MIDSGDEIGPEPGSDKVGCGHPTLSSDLGRRISEVAGRYTRFKFAAEAAGVSVSQLRRYIVGESEPTLGAMAALARPVGVSLDWIATGKGPKHVDDRLAAGHGEPSAGSVVHEAGALPPDFILLPRYDVRAASGSGAVVHSEQVVDYLAFKADWVRRAIGISPDRLGLIENVGSSNEPTIRPGDLLLVDFGIDTVVSEHFYVIGRGDELIIKRIQPLFSGDLVLRSDNTAYLPETIPAERANELRVLGRVIWIGRMI